MAQSQPKFKAQWEWQSNANPWSSEQTQWTLYNQHDNCLLEKAYSNSQDTVDLGGYIVSIKDMIQKKKGDPFKQRRVRRNVEYFKAIEGSKMNEGESTKNKAVNYNNMAHAQSTFKVTAQWEWQSNAGPWSSEKVHWKPYQPFDNYLLEKVFSNNQEKIDLGDYKKNNCWLDQDQDIALILLMLEVERLQGHLAEKNQEIEHLRANQLRQNNSPERQAQIRALARIEELLAKDSSLGNEASKTSDADSKLLVPLLSKISTINKKNAEDPYEAISNYQEKFNELVRQNSYYEEDKLSQPLETCFQDEDFYISGCVLNYHFSCVEKINSAEQVINAANEAKDLLTTYGRKLEQNPRYKLSKMKVTQAALKKDNEIRQKINQSPNHQVVQVLSKIIQDAGSQMLLTDEDTEKELDCLHIFATGGLTDQLIKVTLTNFNSIHFEKMAKDKSYAMGIYKKAKEALIKSQWFDIDNPADIKIVAIECSPALSAVILPQNLISNHPSKRKQVPEVQVTEEPIVRYLSLNCNQFDDKGNMNWDKIPFEKGLRGGLDYYFPKGWKGYGLKVLDKYGSNNDWLEKLDKSGWAVAYHGVSHNPKEKIQSILSSQLNPGQRQVYKADKDSNSLRPCDRPVGIGIYFAKKVQISETYSEKVEVEGKKFKVLLQCKMDPSEVRIPMSEQNYYIVPDGSKVRPYRILVKEFNS